MGVEKTVEPIGGPHPGRPLRASILGTHSGVNTPFAPTPRLSTALNARVSGELAVAAHAACNCAVSTAPGTNVPEPCHPLGYASLDETVE